MPTYPYCGKEVSEDAEYCTTCGQKLDNQGWHDKIAGTYVVAD
jgi:uncharacterized membrane protein YvbJ